VKNPAVGQDVIATGLGLYQSRAGKVTSFVIETLGHPTKDFDVVITGPQGSAVPVRCYQQKDGNLLAEFTAHTAGTVFLVIWNSYVGANLNVFELSKNILILI
jgi:filamin